MVELDVANQFIWSKNRQPQKKHLELLEQIRKLEEEVMQGRRGEWYHVSFLMQFP